MYNYKFGSSYRVVYVVETIPALKPMYVFPLTRYTCLNKIDLTFEKAKRGRFGTT